MISRRRFLVTAGSLGGLALAVGVSGGLSRPSGWLGQAQAAEAFEVSHSNAQWRALLSDAQYRVLREEGTEAPYSSPLNAEHRDGTFACAGCALALFASSRKFDSGTGWPSFWAPLDNAVVSRQDASFGMLRDEVHCRRCGGHQGHVFNDGPAPTGLRYCMNGVAMVFTPAAA